MYGNCCCSGIQGFGAGEVIPGLTLPPWLSSLPALPPNFVPASQADLTATNAAVAQNATHIKYLAIGAGAAVLGILLFK